MDMNGREKMNYPDFTYREGTKNDSKSAMLMNHFCSTFKLPDMIESEMVNNEYVIMHNARMFAKQRDFGSFPNIIAVDLYDKGDIWPAQDLIRNGNNLLVMNGKTEPSAEQERLAGGVVINIRIGLPRL